MNQRSLLTALALVVFSFIFFSVKTNELGYSVPDEKRYVQSVKEMVESGDWITPRYHGKVRFEKPIFFYWASAIPNKITGFNLFSCRFPSIFFASLTVLITYLLGLELFERKVGIVSALFLATSTMFYMYSRFATPDMTLLFFITISIYLFIKGSFLWYFFFMGLAMLTKGPLGVILILIVSAITAKPHLSEVVRKMQWKKGIVIFLAVTLPWFLAMIKLHGSAYIDHILKVETAGRLTSGVSISRIIKAIFRYSIVLVIGFLPMSIFLPSSLARLKKSRARRRLAPANTVLVGWLITVFVFFVFIGTKKAHYMLLASPALALIVGKTIFYKGKDIYMDTVFKLPLLILVGIYVAGVLSVLLLMNYMLESVPIIYYFVSLAPLILLLGIVKKKSYPVIFIASSAIIIMFLVAITIPVLDNKPLLKFAGVINESFKEGDIIGVGSHVISHNRLSRYLDRKVKKVNKDITEPDLYYQTNKYLVTQFLKREERVFCVITKDDYIKLVPQSMKKRLYIIDTENKWKKSNKIDFNFSLASDFLTGKKEAFIKRVREEILLVSNEKTEDRKQKTENRRQKTEKIK